MDKIDTSYEKEAEKIKKGGAVMFLAKKSLTVVEKECGNGLAEALKTGMEIIQGRKRQFMVTDIPPTTNAWSSEECEAMIKDTKNWQEKIPSGNKVVMDGDLCKEVCWEE